MIRIIIILVVISLTFSILGKARICVQAGAPTALRLRPT